MNVLLDKMVRIRDSVLYRFRRLSQIYEERGFFGTICTIAIYIWQPRYRYHQCRWFFVKLVTGNRPIEKCILGHKMYLNPEDSGLSRELGLIGIHEPIETELIQREIKQGMRVVDIGANIGYYVLLEARIVGERGKVFAIEPEPTNVKFLKMNIQTNGYNNIDVYQIAVGDNNRIDKLWLYDKANLHSMIQFNREGIKGSIDVSVLTLDTFCRDKGRVDFVRMDIEGYECNAIKGIINVMKQFHPVLLIEVHPHLVGSKGVIELLKILQRLGYESKYVASRDIRYVGIGSRENFEKLSINELLNDRRLLEGEACFGIFFE